MRVRASAAVGLWHVYRVQVRLDQRLVHVPRELAWSGLPRRPWGRFCHRRGHARTHAAPRALAARRTRENHWSCLHRRLAGGLRSHESFIESFASSRTYCDDIGRGSPRTGRCASQSGRKLVVIAGRQTGGGAGALPADSPRYRISRHSAGGVPGRASDSTCSAWIPTRTGSTRWPVEPFLSTSPVWSRCCKRGCESGGWSSPPPTSEAARVRRRALHLRRHAAEAAARTARTCPSLTAASPRSRRCLTGVAWSSASPRCPVGTARAAGRPARRAGPAGERPNSPGARSSCVRDTPWPTRCGRIGSWSASSRARARGRAARGPCRRRSRPARRSWSPTSPTAELVKVAANAFLATKISFINAMAEVCEAAHADVSCSPRRSATTSGSAARACAPGLGFGGGCLPKDIRAFMARADELGADQALSFLREVDAINMRRRARMVDLARELVRRRHSRAACRVGVLGAGLQAGLRRHPRLPRAGRGQDHPATWAPR